MRTPLILVLALAACTSAAPPAQKAQEEAPTTSPANVSHGEAPVGEVGSPPPVDATAPPRSSTRLHLVRLEMRDTVVTIAEGVRYHAWTFGGQVPGPVLRVTVGDTVDFTLVNRAMMPHSMDFHAAEVAPSRVYTNVMPNDSLHYRWVAQVPGVFMYHCGTAPVAMHIANGMYGAVIVDPVRPRPAAHEYVLIQSEFYTMPGSGAD